MRHGRKEGRKGGRVTMNTFWRKEKGKEQKRDRGLEKGEKREWQTYHVNTEQRKGRGNGLTMEKKGNK